MRRLDDTPIDPEIAASLDAIDATLAGDPVDPRYAELAELALLLVDTRPEMEPAAAQSLDARVERRFAPESRPARGKPRRARLWGTMGATAVGLAAAVGLVMVIASAPGGSSMSSSSATVDSLSAGAAKAPAATTATTASAGTAANPSAGAASAAPGLQPPNNGRKIVQSAQLSLSAPPTHIDDVAQEVFDVIGAENGIVNRSSVTATGGADGYAQFQLGVPSANLSQTMTELSRLRYASVVSRTDATQDVNDQYVSETNKLADDQALRSSLLKQLGNAGTQAEIDSLNARLHDAEQAIAADQAALRSLNHRVNNSQITLTINAVTAPVAVSNSHGFTLGRAAHDAGRVLTVAAGVALIVLAALAPVALVVVLAWWIATALRRRRREQALDAV
jgi:uncharacterized membrane protein (Fun14 family)